MLGFFAPMGKDILAEARQLTAGQGTVSSFNIVFMRVVFLTANVLHHLCLIDKVNEQFPVEVVLFQQSHIERGTVSSLFKQYLEAGRLDLFFRRVFSKLIFFWERRNERAFEKRFFFKDRPVALNPSIKTGVVRSFNDPETIEMLQRLAPDIFIVFGTEVLKPPVLKIAKLGIINIHRSILPKYRGGGLPYWTFYENDFATLGCTVHTCAELLDAGAILSQRFYKVEPDHKIWQVRGYTTVLALDCVLETLGKFKDGTLKPIPQSHGRNWRTRDLTLWKQIVAHFNFWMHTRELKRK